MAALVARIRNTFTSNAPMDKYVWLTVIGLASFGVVAVYSAVGYFAETSAGGNTGLLLTRHVVRILLALGAALIFSMIDYRWLARMSKFLLLAAVALLVITQMSGNVFGGAQRWLSVGGVSFQASDFAKVALVLHIGVLLAKKQPYIQDFQRSFMPVMFWAAPTLLLIGMEDLSTAGVLAVAIGIMAFVARIRVLHLIGAGAVLMIFVFIFLMFSPARAARVESFLGTKIFPHTEEVTVFSAQHEGYQARQARIAFAMGGLTGVGPGKSIQRDFLPAPFNDFIYAIIGEEYGLIGATGLLFLFTFLLFRGMLRIAREAPDPLGLFLAIGFTCAICLYAFVNAAVACGLFPVTGLPMPFVSYGGTSLLATGVMAGILLNISRHVDPDPA